MFVKAVVQVLSFWYVVRALGGTLTVVVDASPGQNEVAWSVVIGEDPVSGRRSRMSVIFLQLENACRPICERFLPNTTEVNAVQAPKAVVRISVQVSGRASIVWSCEQV